MKLDIRNIKRIENSLKKNKQIQTKEYEEKCFISSRNWFIKEFSLPLGGEISTLINRGHKLGIRFDTGSVVNSFEYNRNYFEDDDFGDIYLIMMYETNKNHIEKTIDYENKRFLMKFYFCNDKCCKVVK